MTNLHSTRRHALLSGLGLLAASAMPAAAGGMGIHVVKDPNCGCCGAWIEIVAAAGFAVTTEHADAEALARHKTASGVPDDMASCHTARVEDYVLEGHVPVDDIRRLLAERPDAIGLAVPGMPWGAPGMGPETEREGFDVFLIHRGGGTSVFARHAAA